MGASKASWGQKTNLKGPSAPSIHLIQRKSVARKVCDWEIKDQLGHFTVRWVFIGSQWKLTHWKKDPPISADFLKDFYRLMFLSLEENGLDVSFRFDWCSHQSGKIFTTSLTDLIQRLGCSFALLATLKNPNWLFCTTTWLILATAEVKYERLF